MIRPDLRRRGRSLLRLLLVVPVASIALSGCQRRPPVERAALPAAAGPVARATSAEPDPGFVGVVVAGEAAEIEARVEGRIEAVFVQPGQTVVRGAPIARLDHQAATHELAAARAALTDASRRYSRRRRLARVSRAIAAEELDGVRRELLQERARVARLQEVKANALVTAPFDGTVVSCYLSAGALAGPGRPIARLMGRAEPRVRFAIPEERAAAVALGSPVHIRVVPGGRTLAGTVSGVSPEVDASSRMIYAAATLVDPGPPTAGLTTGLVARVYPAASGGPVPTAPR